MHTFFIFLGTAVLAYRVFVKGESIVVKNPNWKMRGLACFIIGLSLLALSVYSLIALYLRHVPILGILWIALAAGVFITALSVRIMMRVSPSASDMPTNIRTRRSTWAYSADSHPSNDPEKRSEQGGTN
jgi:hypothetical protein